MELSARETAALMGLSPRAIRARLARGDLPGTKRNGRWCVPRHRVPLTEGQRQTLQSKADTIRDAVEEVLPSRLAESHGRRHRSLADLDAFRYGVDLLREMRESPCEALSEPASRRIQGHVEEGLLALAEAVQQFDRPVKLDALQRSRAHLARATALLLVEAGVPPPDPIHGWVGTLEGHVIPAVAGFARWADRLGKKK